MTPDRRQISPRRGVALQNETQFLAPDTAEAHHVRPPLCHRRRVGLLLSGNAMAQDRISISSAWGEVTAELADNAAARALSRSFPVTIQMGDHLRQ
jgi:hypothetical protein